MTNSHSFVKLFLAFIFSTAFIWLATYFFDNSLLTYDYDSTLDEFIPSPNSLYKHRNEGWGTTHIGKYGINAIPDITKINNPKIAIWGDSYVTAYHVNDDEKLAQVATSLFKFHGTEDLVFFGAGIAGDDIADYYFNIPKYEKIVPLIKAHFIIITSFDDTLPDTNNKRSVFKSDPYRLVNEKWEPKFQNIKKMLNKYNLGFIWKLVERLIKNPDFRFMPGTAALFASSQKPESTDQDFSESSSFLLKELRKQTKLPMVFVYAPNVPRIDRGSIAFSDPEAQIADEFSKKCFRYGIDFINLGDDFKYYYRDTGKFPRGFQNSFPGKGHFNVDGHGIVARAIFRYIRDTDKI